MGTENAIHSVNERQLRNTRRKIVSVRTLVQQLLAEDFPYSQGKKLLETIDALLLAREERLASTDPSVESRVVNRLCQESQETISLYLPLVGFVLRSTNIRNAFELYAPLLDIVRKALGSEANLVVSSEWEFSPYTLIPPRIGGEQFVLIGLPASESENALASPLAGHELGHNVWSSEGLERKYEPLVEEGLAQAIKSSFWKEIKALFPRIRSKNQVSDLLGRQVLAAPWRWCLRQLQELFCDSIGLLLFAESYLHAFAYLVAPAASMERSKLYPATIDRVNFLVRNAERAGYGSPPDYREHFEPDTLLESGANSVLLSLADQVRKDLEDELFGDAERIMARWGLPAHNQNETQTIYDSFVALTPAIEATSLANIVNAGWRMYLSGFVDWDQYVEIKSNSRKAESVLNDLMLKSAEVFEIQRMRVKQ